MIMHMNVIAKFFSAIDHDDDISILSSFCYCSVPSLLTF